MTLPLDVARCQGRQGRGPMGSALVGECVNCQRFTDRPADVQSVQWMEPPQQFYWARFGFGQPSTSGYSCPSRIAPSEVVVEIDGC